MTPIVFIIAILLAIISYIDIRYKELPSIFLTGLIFTVLFFNFNNLQWGVIAFVFAYMLYEGSFISGIADIKMITLVGLMISNMFFFGIFALLIMVLGIGEKLLIKYGFKKDYDFAFIPIIFITYLILLIAGGIA